jgi:hypothetical protein
MSSTLSRTTLLVGAACLAGPAAGQSLNLDFGSVSAGSGTPGPAYAGAAAQPGDWNAIDCDMINTMPWTSGALIDVNGAATGVTVTLDEPNSFTPFCLNFNEANTTGDDQALMDDIHYFGGVSSLTISGLADGNYAIYSYAMAPDSAAFLTNVSVAGSIDPPQDVGGNFAAGHALGVTYALHNVTVSGGSDVVVDYAISVSFDSMNGMQIVSSGGGGNLAIACDPANNHSGGTYVKLDQSSFSGPGVLHLEATDGPSGEFGYFLVSLGFNDPGTPISNGMLCLTVPIGRYAPAAGGSFNSIGQFDAGGVLQNLVGTSSVGSGYDVLATLPTPPGGVIQGGTSYYFQCWFRDGNRSNFSNVLQFQ